MKAVVYSIKPFEKEYLAKANEKKHDITLISNPLGIDTVSFAQGKDAVVVFTNDDVSAPVIEKLKKFGVKYIATRSVGLDHIDCDYATQAGIKIANVPSYSPQSIAEHAVALMMALNRKIFLAIQNAKEFNFSLDGLQGFTMYGKVVGLIGFGAIAQYLARILHGFGCTVLVYDPYCQDFPEYVKQVNLDELYRQSNIISLHTPLTAQTKHIINTESISKMRKDVMLINTGRGALINTVDLLHAIRNGRIGSFGADVYENEKRLFFEDHHNDEHKDQLLQSLMNMPNVIVTPHQAFLTTEALQDIAAQTIKNLDHWQLGECTGESCACTVECEDSKKNREKPIKPIGVDIMY
ncbi:2-hydroxyacid dehydrogenase [Pelobium manganitolerans]|uniref:2-hydroxyacid dehydrogenase n=1 Tax=Pelobium manganitolerans TaxID=1842495 RepID=UPI003FA3C11E